jgi:hypothetical protein
MRNENCKSECSHYTSETVIVCLAIWQRGYVYSLNTLSFVRQYVQQRVSPSYYGLPLRLSRHAIATQVRIEQAVCLSLQNTHRHGFKWQRGGCDPADHLPWYRGGQEQWLAHG